MSTSDFVIHPQDDPNKQLHNFILDVEARLDELVAARHILFYDEVREPLRVDLEGLKDGQLAGLRNDLYEPKGEMMQRLEDVGLTGNSLNTKLTAYANLRNQLTKMGGIKLTKLLLKSIVKILGSLILFSKFAEAIKEFVEVLELLVDEAKDK